MSMSSDEAGFAQPMNFSVFSSCLLFMALFLLTPKYLHACELSVHCLPMTRQGEYFPRALQQQMSEKLQLLLLGPYGLPFR